MDYNIPITKYEKVRVIGLRATQIANGSKPLVDVENMIDPLKMAEKEFDCGKIPINIIRTLPNGRKISVNIKPN
jgi:DNA-directed RNA polymerase subunit K/omega